MSTLSHWLESIGLQRYLAVFERNDIELDTLKEINNKDLETLGVSLGHRKRLMKAIEELKHDGLAGPIGEGMHSHAGSATRPLGTDGERRQLTVLFCDLVGSTELSTRMDPEVERNILRGYWDICTRAIARFEGYFFQRQGDGVVAYFGFPVAHEDAPERAIRAGLNILEDIAELPWSEAGQPLSARIGISTGVVVISDLRSEDRSAVGDTMNLTARLQTLAQPGTIVVSDNTRRLAGGSFEYKDMGTQSLKGFPRPVQTWCVVGARRGEGRFEAATRGGLSPFVGRKREIASLLKRWERVEQGEGQAVALFGEPGIGKSRVLRTFRDRVGARATRVLWLQCSPFSINSALHPIIDFLEREIRITPEQQASTKLDRLEALMIDQVGRSSRDVSLIASLLGISDQNRYAPISMTPQRQKQETLQTLVDLVGFITCEQPSLLLFEDIHWADSSTLEALDLLISRIGRFHLLLLATYRPELEQRWKPHGTVAAIPISRLDRSQSSHLIRALAGDHFPRKLSEQILDKAGGIPLFLEELTKITIDNISDADDQREHWLGQESAVSIPTTLRDSLVARLDRLASAKVVAQVGSVLGREFSYEMLHAVAPTTTDELERSLQRLIEEGLLFRRGTPPAATYTFKHALIQDAAYESLLKSSRQQLHERIARLLHTRFPTISEGKPELLAHHYTEAGLRDVAVPLWCAAGKNAVARSANIEAIGHLNRGLEVLKSLPYRPEHDRQELLLQTLLGNALMATRGYGAPEVGHTFDRARALCERLGETPQLFPVLRGLWMFYLVRSELRTAMQLADQIMQLAERVQEPALLLEAHRSVGMTLFFIGKFRPARHHLERGIELYDPQAHREHAYLYGTDPGVACLCYLAATLWIMGFADQAITRLHEGLGLAEKSGHSFSRSFAYFFAAMIYQYRREAAPAQRQADIDIAFSKEEGFVLWLAMATIVRGWTRAEQGRKRDGLTEMREGLSAYRATGARLAHTYIFSLLGEVCGKAKQFDEGLSVLGEALATSADTGERVFEAELYRLKGEVMLQARGTTAMHGNNQVISTAQKLIGGDRMEENEPEYYFSKAIDIARAQESHAFQLRAAMGLCRAWRMKGKAHEARCLLEDLYDGFGEGFDSPDLRDARQLLEELC